VWTREAVEGRWFGTLRLAADAFIRHASEKVTGTVTYRLRPGAMDICAIRASQPLYLCDRDGWEKSLIDDRFLPAPLNSTAQRHQEVLQ
jgi:argininosuccinate synthase